MTICSEEVESVPAPPASKPDSDVVLAEPEEAALIEVMPASEVLEVEAIVEDAELFEEAAPVAAEPLALEPAEVAAPMEAEPDLSALFEEASVPSVGEASPGAAAPDEEPDLSALFSESTPMPMSAPHMDVAIGSPSGLALAAELPLDDAVAEEIASPPPVLPSEPEEFAFVDEIAEPAPVDIAGTPPLEDAAEPAADLFAIQEAEQRIETPVEAVEDAAPLLEGEADVVAATGGTDRRNRRPPRPGSRKLSLPRKSPKPRQTPTFSPWRSRRTLSRTPLPSRPKREIAGSAARRQPGRRIGRSFSPGSAVVVAEEPVEAIAEAAAVESEEVAPGSAVFAAEEPVEEIAEAASASAVVESAWNRAPAPR